MFEVILTFGNYMNSGKRAAAYGFKIQSLDMVSYCKCLCLDSMLILGLVVDAAIIPPYLALQLMATRSTDRKMNLLQYIVQLMRDRFPEHAEFCDEVLYLKKAGLGMCWGSFQSTCIAGVYACLCEPYGTI